MKIAEVILRYPVGGDELYPSTSTARCAKMCRELFCTPYHDRQGNLCGRIQGAGKAVVSVGIFSFPRVFAFLVWDIFLRIFIEVMGHNSQVPQLLQIRATKY